MMMMMMMMMMIIGGGDQTGIHKEVESNTKVKT